MPTVESLNKRLDALDEERGYFAIEDFVSARPMEGESMVEAAEREHPFKTFDPSMVQSLRLAVK